MALRENLKNIKIPKLPSDIQIPTDPLLWRLIYIFVFIFLSQFVVLYFILPSEETHMENWYRTQWIPTPVKILSPPKNSTIQDRYEYSFKDLKAQLDVELIHKIYRKMNPPPKGRVLGYQDIPDVARQSYSQYINRVYWRVLECISLDIKEKGFYVEYGGGDGANYSNTLRFDISSFPWKGLLIEPDPIAFQRLKNLRRHAWTINAGVSIHPREETCTFLRSKDQYGGEIMKNFAHVGIVKTPADEFDEFDAPCYPLASMLLAINQTKVGLLSLDMEGAALSILKTIPWNLIEIKVILVIEVHTNSDKQNSLLKYMMRQGFVNRGSFEGEWMNADVFTNEKYT